LWNPAFLAITAAVESLPFGQRLILAFAWFFRVIFDGHFAKKLALAAQREGEAPPVPVAPAPVVVPAPAHDTTTPALVLLSLLQREGRLVDFLQQDLASNSDAEVGAGARVVHAGCRKAIEKAFAIVPLRSEQEESTLEVPPGFNAAELTLTGRVSGSGPYKGTLTHRGWRATRAVLAVAHADHNAQIVAPAEVEIA
jgi:hypothetical protein